MLSVLFQFSWHTTFFPAADVDEQIGPSDLTEFGHRVCEACEMAKQGETTRPMVQVDFTRDIWRVFPGGFADSIFCNYEVFFRFSLGIFLLWKLLLLVTHSFLMNLVLSMSTGMCPLPHQCSWCPCHTGHSKHHGWCHHGCCCDDGLMHILLLTCS